MVEQTHEKPNFPQGWLSIAALRFALAVTFLTHLSLPIRSEVRPVDQRVSMGWYPLIGAGLGTVGYCFLVGFAALLPPHVAAALVVILLELFTGALHLDGLMDTCDGVGSNAPPARALEIMKDSRVGAMGVFGAIAIILLKVMALASLSSSQALLPLLLGWATARTLPVLNVSFFKYARPSGTGSLFVGERSPFVIIIAFVTTFSLGWLLGGFVGITYSAAIMGVTLLIQLGIARRLGGLTGDVYGFGVEIAETLALLAGCGLVRWISI